MSLRARNVLLAVFLAFALGSAFFSVGSRSAKWKAQAPVTLREVPLLELEPPKLGSNLPKILGCEKVTSPNGSFSTACEFMTDWTAIGSDASATLWGLGGQNGPQLQSGELMRLAAICDLNYGGDAGLCNDAGNCDAEFQRDFFGRYTGGVFSNPVGSTTDRAVTTLVGGLLDGSACDIVWDGGPGIGVVASCSNPCVASTSISLNRRLAYNPVITPTVTSASPSVLATVYGTGQTVTINTTSGAAAGATTASFAGVNLSSCSAGSSSVTCTLPAGTYSAGTGNLTVTSPENPTACVGCGSFAASRVLSISPSSGVTSGGTNVTITLNAGATGGCGIPPTLAGVACTSCAVVSDTTITCTSAGSSDGGPNSGAVVVSSPSSPTSSVTWSYVNAPPTLSSVVTPNAAPATGGTSFTVHGTNLSGATSLTIGGVAATSLSCTSTACTAVAPAVGTSAGSSAGSTVTVTTAGGSGSSSTLFYQQPTDSLESDGGTVGPAMWHRGDVGLTTSGESDIISAGSTNNWAWTGTPSISSTINGLSVVTFNGSTQYGTLSTSGPCGTSPTSIVTVATATSLAGSVRQNIIMLSAPTPGGGFTSHMDFFSASGDPSPSTMATSNYNTSNIYWTTTTVAANTPVCTASILNIAGAAPGPGTAAISVNGGTLITSGGTSSSSNLTGGAFLATQNNNAGGGGYTHYLNGSVAEDIVYCGSLSQNDVNVLCAIAAAVW